MPFLYLPTNHILNSLRLTKPSVMVTLCTANRDPLVKILGPGFATIEGEDTTVIRMVDKVRYDIMNHNLLNCMFHISGFSYR